MKWLIGKTLNVMASRWAKNGNGCLILMRESLPTLSQKPGKDGKIAGLITVYSDFPSMTQQLSQWFIHLAALDDGLMIWLWKMLRLFFFFFFSISGPGLCECMASCKHVQASYQTPWRAGCAREPIMILITICFIHPKSSHHPSGWVQEKNEKQAFALHTRNVHLQILCCQLIMSFFFCQMILILFYLLIYFLLKLSLSSTITVVSLKWMTNLHHLCCETPNSNQCRCFGWNFKGGAKLRHLLFVIATLCELHADNLAV